MPIVKVQLHKCFKQVCRLQGAMCCLAALSSVIRNMDAYHLIQDNPQVFCSSQTSFIMSTPEDHLLLCLFAIMSVVCHSKVTATLSVRTGSVLSTARLLQIAGVMLLGLRQTSGKSQLLCIISGQPIAAACKCNQRSRSTVLAC